MPIRRRLGQFGNCRIQLHCIAEHFAGYPAKPANRRRTKLGARSFALHRVLALAATKIWPLIIEP